MLKARWFPSMNRKNVFVVGLDEFNREQLTSLPEARGYNIRAAITVDELKVYWKRPVSSLLELAEKRLDAEEPDAIITWWDFPGTLLAAILNERHGLPGPRLKEMFACEHKYWSRLEQTAAYSEAVPEFRVIDPRRPPSFEDITIAPPFWLKPIKATDSMLSFHVGNRAEYRDALEQIRRDIGYVARPFNELLSRIDLPEKVRGIDGNHCLVEASCSGSQHTVSGYVHDGEVVAYGVIDSLHYPDSSCFFAYVYPSRLPPRITQRMMDISKRVISQIGLRSSAWNIEFFYDDTTDQIKLLEVNPRISQSHADIYHKVDGKSNESLLIELALGQRPSVSNRRGDYPMAAKFYYRHFEDGVVRRTPTRQEIESLRKRFPGLLIHVAAEEGHRLSERLEHDSYSFVLAELFLGAAGFEELKAQYDRVVESLPFEID